MYQKLIQYKAKYGTTRVTKSKEEELFLFSSSSEEQEQHQQHYSDMMIDDGSISNNSDYSNTNEQSLTQAHQSHSHSQQVQVQVQAQAQNVILMSPLRLWIFRQRALFQCGKLPKNRIQKLNSIGFLWDANKNSSNNNKGKQGDECDE